MADSDSSANGCAGAMVAFGPLDACRECGDNFTRRAKKLAEREVHDNANAFEWIEACLKVSGNMP